MSAHTAPSRSEFATTLQIIPVVFFTFICYLTIGIPLAVLPGYVHDDLGFSAIIAGAAISVQYRWRPSPRAPSPAARPTRSARNGPSRSG